MKSAIIFDTEFMVDEGAPSRFCNGPYDPDPQVVQIGAVKLGLHGDFPILGNKRIYIKAMDRFGQPAKISPFFSRLTNITDEDFANEGVSLSDALSDLIEFADGDQLWSWGKDELNLIG